MHFVFFAHEKKMTKRGATPIFAFLLTLRHNIIIWRLTIECTFFVMTGDYKDNRVSTS